MPSSDRLMKIRMLFVVPLAVAMFVVLLLVITMVVMTPYRERQAYRNCSPS